MKKLLLPTIILIGLWCSVWTARRRKVKEKPSNNVIFEKVLYEITDRSIDSHDWVEIRPVATNVMSEFLDGNSNNPFFNLIRDNIYEFFSDSGAESNFQLKCPVPPGVLYIVSVEIIYV